MGKGESSVVVLDQHPMWVDGIRGVMEEWDSPWSEPRPWPPKLSKR